MKKILIICLTSMLLTGCSTIDTIKKYWPRNHDPVMFEKLVNVDVGTERINCDTPNWKPLKETAEELARYAEWRDDPQTENLLGLAKHFERMEKGGSKMFCEIGKKTARQRIDAAKSAWKGR